MSNVDPSPLEDRADAEPPQEPASPLSGYRFKEGPDSFAGEVRGCLWTVVAWPWRLGCWMTARLSAGPTYHVPPRFGMSAILGITTALALLFGLFRMVDAHPLIYLFTAILVAITCVVQMRWGRIARPASIVAGAIWLPVFILALFIAVSFTTDDRPPIAGIVCAMVFCIPLGGLFGYLAGTCAGGFFLLMELFEKYWERRTAGSRLDDPQDRG